MDDAISRKGTSAWLENMGYSYPAKVIMDEKRFPSVVPKRGRWIHDGSKWTNRWICSECGYKWFFDCIEGAYCPNCGCQMNGD